VKHSIGISRSSASNQSSRLNRIMANSIVPASPESNQSSPFDAIRRFDDKGHEYWKARELQKVLGYIQWRRFEDAIDRAKCSLENQGLDVTNHIATVGKLDSLATLAAPKTPEDYKLSRHACYTIAMNGDPRKPEIAQAQSYFVAKTRQAETIQPLSPAELLIAQGQAMLAIEKEQARLEAKQLELESKLALEAQRTAELEKFVHQHDAEIDRLFSPNGHYFSVVGYARNRGLRMPIDMAKSIGGKCSQYCKSHDIPIEKLNDSRWGSVGSYPEDVIEMFL
jgi:DNA-damage-inducible protein D